MGVGTVDPKPKKLEHRRTHPSYNPETSPTHQKNSVPDPVTLTWKNSGEPTGKIMNKTIKRRRGREPRKGKQYENALYDEQNKTTNTCKGARIAPSRLPLTQ